MTVGVSLQEHILNDLAKEISQEIDNEVMCELLEEDGWVKVRAQKHHDFNDIVEWVNKNKTGEVFGHKYVWAFTEEKDATWFALHWS